MRFTITPDICLKENDRWNDLPDIVFILTASEQQKDWSGSDTGGYDYHRIFGKYQTVDSAIKAAEIVASYIDMEIVELEIPTQGVLFR